MRLLLRGSEAPPPDGARLVAASTSAAEGVPAATASAAEVAATATATREVFERGQAAPARAAGPQRPFAAIAAAYAVAFAAHAAVALRSGATAVVLVGPRAAGFTRAAADTAGRLAGGTAAAPASGYEQAGVGCQPRSSG